MYDTTVVYAAQEKDGRYSATVDLSNLVQPLLEPEIVFKLRAAPASDQPRDLLDTVEWIAHGCELVQCHFPDWKFTVADTIADGGLHGRYVVGPPLVLDDALRTSLPAALESFTASDYKDGELMAFGGGSLVLDSPLNTLSWLVQVLARLPQHPALEGGEIVTTGTLTSALPVVAGEVWTTSIEGLDLPGLELRFV
jgi:2-oxo-3-hexenedioate decarboxylase